MVETRHAPAPRVDGEERFRGLRLIGGAGSEMRPGTTRVLVAYGDRLARAGLQALLERERDIELVRIAGGGEEALAVARELAPDVAVLDLALSGLDAIEVTRRIVADPVAAVTRPLIVGAAADEQTMLTALRAGALGFLLDPEYAELVAAIRSVAGGAAALSPVVLRRMVG
jgi:DNA-binding NarL/FixJ family response regulator